MKLELQYLENNLPSTFDAYQDARVMAHQTPNYNGEMREFLMLSIMDLANSRAQFCEDEYSTEDFNADNCCLQNLYKHFNSEVN